MKRLDKAARYCGVSRQKFCESAVMAEVAETERRQFDRRATRDEQRTQTPRTPDTDGSGPAGLGLAAALRGKSPTAEEQTTAPQAPVVVNVGTTGSGGGAVGGDSIERLATFVTAAHDFERERRLRQAVEVLRVTASTDEERRVLAARLDEAIAAKAAAKPQGGGPVARVARVAFDKLAALTR
jgi:hypothetical protein